MGIRVVSKRAGGVKAKQGETVINIARPSVLGNPYHMANESQRTKVIDQYRVWLRNQYQTNTRIYHELHDIAAKVKAGIPVALECWCAPCACHGDVIIQAVEAINKRA